MWVLESAHRYARASAVLLHAHLTYESEVNAALSMELLIKSLLAEPVANERAGTSLQQYRIPRSLGIKDGHNLWQLYQKVPFDIAEKLGLRSHEWVLEKKQNVFKSARYIYEENAPRSSDTQLLQTVSWLLPQVIVHFSETGQADQWVEFMVANPKEMQISSVSELLLGI
ncbi:hypothetical protein [Pseudomonas nitroreducens]|uniref:hypothetical protein n=1 Tax=Pseudomonas nitroreducens TaxID=46680 RepID=UPI002D8011BB|nr:hypothetical protein [Pseudomonas nitroreducens]